MKQEEIIYFSFLQGRKIMSRMSLQGSGRQNVSTRASSTPGPPGEKKGSQKEARRGRDPILSTLKLHADFGNSLADCNLHFNFIYCTLCDTAQFFGCLIRVSSPLSSLHTHFYSLNITVSLAKFRLAFSVLLIVPVFSIYIVFLVMK